MSVVGCVVAPSESPTGPVSTRVVVGRARVAQEITACAPLMARPGVPVSARGPWSTAVLHAPPGLLGRAQARALLLHQHPQGRPVGAALLCSRRRGPVTEVRLLGDGAAPPPPGTAPRRLHAVSADVADRLAAALSSQLREIRGPWRVELTGLPMGDPTLAALADRLGTGATFATTRSRALVDTLDEVGEVTRSRDAATLEGVLPWLLDRRPTGSDRSALRALARVHAAAGVLEHAVVRRGDHVVAALLTLVEGGTRRPWWGSSQIGGLQDAPGQPLVSLSAASWRVSR